MTRKLESLISKNGGYIVFINSTAGLSVRGDYTGYSISKFGLKAAADGIRERLNHQGIRVTSIFLGRTDTPMQQLIHNIESSHYNPAKLIQTSEIAELIVQLITISRSSEITDIVMRPLIKL